MPFVSVSTVWNLVVKKNLPTRQFSLITISLERDLPLKMWSEYGLLDSGCLVKVIAAFALRSLLRFKQEIPILESILLMKWGRVGEKSSGLRHCDRIGMISVQTPSNAWTGSGIEHHYKAADELRVKPWQNAMINVGWVKLSSQ